MKVSYLLLALSLGGASCGLQALPYCHTAAVAAAASAEATVVGTHTDAQGIQYQLLSDHTATVTSGKDAAGALVIPDEINKAGDATPYKVTAIGAGAFAFNKEITAITFPKGLTSIGANAFYNCNKVTSIVIPEGVTSLPNTAFQNCRGLVDLTLPEGLTSIGYRTFAYCSELENLTLPESLESIGEQAFYECGALSSITLPANLTETGAESFMGCKNLKEATLSEGLVTIGAGSFSGCNSLAKVTFPNGLATIGDEAFNECTVLTDVVLPAGLKAIGASAFENCRGLTALTLPEGLEAIGENAFSYSYLTEVTLPSSLATLDDGAFAYCSRLERVTIPGEVERLPDDAFRYCSKLSSITLPATLRSIGRYAFYGCSKLTDVSFLSKSPENSFADDFATSPTLHVYPEAVEAYQGLYAGLTVVAFPHVALSVTDAGYATYYASQGTYQVPDGLRGAVVTAAAGGALTLDYRYESGEVVPEGTGLILKGDEGGYNLCEVPGLTPADADNADNLLRGTDADQLTTADDGADAVFYKLSYNDDRTKVGFYWGAKDGAAFTNPANRCYLALPKAAYAHFRGFALDGGGALTGLDDALAAPGTDAQGQGNAAVYTIDGRRVATDGTSKLPAGLYIVNGQKVIVK